MVRLLLKVQVTVSPACRLIAVTGLPSVQDVLSSAQLVGMLTSATE